VSAGMSSAGASVESVAKWFAINLTKVYLIIETDGQPPTFIEPRHQRPE